MSVNIIWLVLVFACVQTNGSAQKIGPFKSIPKEIVRCEDEGIDYTPEFELQDPKLRKIKKDTFAYSGMAILHRELPVTAKLRVDVSVFGNGGWKPNYITNEFDSFCNSTVLYFPSIANNFFEIANKTGGGEMCPIKEGTYPINVTLSGVDIKQVPQFMYGTYKAIAKIIIDDKVVGCYGMIADVVPKKEKRNKG